MTPQKRVLVVEDDSRTRDLLVDIVSVLGYDASGVDDGVAALDAILQSKPDLILLDLIMPRATLDGVGFLLRLSANACDIPIIILSALGGTLAQEMSHPPSCSADLRVVAILTKPVTVNALSRHIEETLGLT